MYVGVYVGVYAGVYVGVHVGVYMYRHSRVRRVHRGRRDSATATASTASMGGLERVGVWVMQSVAGPRSAVKRRVQPMAAAQPCSNL